MNTDSNNPGFGVTTDDIRAYDWQAGVAAVQSRDCQTYCDELAKQAKSLKEAGDDRGNRVFRLLATVVSYCPNYDSNETPYRPWAIWPDGSHSPSPEELTPPDLDTLAGILAEIRDAEFRARVGDVLWVSRKDYKAAQVPLMQSTLDSRHQAKLHRHVPAILGFFGHHNG